MLCIASITKQKYSTHKNSFEDYEEIENWIAEGRVDFGFLRLPTRKDFETIELEKDQQMVVLPKNHP